MDKNAIKKYAIWAREELIKRVSTKAEEYGIRADADISLNVEAIGDRVLTDTEKKQRTALIKIIEEKGFVGAMEEAAYTWFNRFIALRFMEVNGYLPSKVRVFTDDENNFKPQILDEAIHMELEGLNLEKVLDLKEQNKTDELYKYLIITQCNALHSVLPKMFPKIDDYTQLLFPDNILREGSAIEQMIAIIPEEDFKDAVQILGWLYQYYNSVPKDTVFANLKKNIKITKENIPAATQLFTPDWIVRYMVENSLGRIAVDKFGVDPVSMGWKYYLEEAEQTEEVQNQLKIINSEKTTLEELKVIDPCMGSGHILVYAFDVLVQIYESQGYTARDAVASILENNLFGLDIDERAYQLAYFALMMKAQSYDRRFLKRTDKPSPQVYCPKGYADGEEYGSLLNVDELEEKPQGLGTNEQASLFDDNYEISLNTWNFRRLLNQKYDVVMTNPPYMGSRKGMNPKVKKYVEKNYKDSKSDLYTCFIEKCIDLCKKYRYASLITQQSFMFTDDYKELRAKLLNSHSLHNLVHLGSDTFEEISGEVVQNSAFVYIKNYQNEKFTSKCVRLVDYPCLVKPFEFKKSINYHLCDTYRFKEIKANPFSYWLSEKMRNSFSKGDTFEEVGVPKAGITTGNNDEFLNFWYEIDILKLGLNYTSTENFHISKKLYAPYNKGGKLVKWYGNNDNVIKFNEKNYNLLLNQGNHLPSRQYYFKECITWSDISGRSFAARYFPQGSVFDVKGSCGFPNETNFYLAIAFLNSKLTPRYIDALNPTTTTQVGDLKRIPIIKPSENEMSIIDGLSKNCINITKSVYDSFETSWNFEKHPFIKVISESDGKIEDSFGIWKGLCDMRFEKLKDNEEELNRIFIDIYGLQDELTPEVEDKDITVRPAKLDRDIKSFISYAVGCMFGRYSLDVDGLAYAGGEFDSSKYTSFIPDKDNVIPICDDEYFEDDIVGRFIEFVKVVYGADTLEENLDFIASALGGKGTSRDVIRTYFLNSFYADHCKIYQKRPIYWQLESGKKNGFKALIYMHRYEQDTMARVRTDYVHEQQGRYRTAIADLERRIQDASTSERVKLTKQLTALKDQETEIRIFEEKIHHLADQMIRIDLDDGVKNNYAKFSDVLTKIK